MTMTRPDPRVAFTDEDAGKLTTVANTLENIANNEEVDATATVAYLRDLARRCSHHQRSCPVCGEGRIAPLPPEGDHHLDGCPLGGVSEGASDQSNVALPTHSGGGESTAGGDGSNQPGRPLADPEDRRDWLERRAEDLRAELEELEAELDG